jgi:stage V sporulation protein AE
MIFLNAFILGGLVCVFFQLVMLIPGMNPPKTLIFGFFLGGLITPLGIADKLLAWGNAGLTVMVPGAGNAVAGTTGALLAGNPEPFIIVIGIFVCLTLAGIIGGAITAALNKKK